MKKTITQQQRRFLMNMVNARAHCMRPILAAGFALAMALTFNACGSDSGGGDGGDSSSSGAAGGKNQSSSGGASGSGKSSSSGECDESVGGYSGSYGSLSYEGQTYKTVKIGTQTWMAENLNYAAEGSECYDKEPENCAKYGRLYDWYIAMALPGPAACSLSDCAGQVSAKHRGICPSGWHLPSKEEWNVLRDFVNSDNGCSSNCDAWHLKVKGCWSDNAEYGLSSVYQPSPGRDTYGFAALPGGCGYPGVFGGAGYHGYWWSASEDEYTNAYYLYMHNHFWFSGLVSYEYAVDKSIMYSVRCLQD